MHKLKLLSFISVMILFLIVENISAQEPDTNLDIFYKMIDSSVTDLISKIPKSRESIKLDLNLGESYTVFNNRIIAGIFSSGKKILDEENKELLNINYVLEKANVNYGEIFRDGFWGDYYLPRNLSLKGSYAIRDSNTLFQNFDYNCSDTIRYSSIKDVEDESFPFTKGKVPSEPFFSNLFEPIVAIGTAALVVILFFTIRSK
jgi:hypothetical protein